MTKSPSLNRRSTNHFDPGCTTWLFPREKYFILQSVLYSADAVIR